MLCLSPPLFYLLFLISANSGVRPVLVNGGQHLVNGPNQAMTTNRQLGAVISMAGSLNSHSLSITERDSLMIIAMLRIRTDGDNFPLLCTIHGLRYRGGETPLCNRYYYKYNIHCTYMTEKKFVLGGRFWYFYLLDFLPFFLCALMYSCTPVVNFISLHRI